MIFESTIMIFLGARLLAGGRNKLRKTMTVKHQMNEPEVLTHEDL